MLFTDSDIIGLTSSGASYEDIESFAISCRGKVQQPGYAAVVGVASGGLYLATIISEMAELPFAIALYDKNSALVMVKNLPPSNPGQRVLLVEDEESAGHILLKTRYVIESAGHELDLLRMPSRFSLSS